MYMPKRFLHFSSNVLLLFKEWFIENTPIFIASLICLFVFTLLYEIAKFYHSGNAKTRRNGAGSLVVNQTERSTSRIYGTFEVPSQRPRSVPEWSERLAFARNACSRVLLTWRYLLSSFSYIVLVGAGYLVMLTVMTYNAWFFIAVCLASGFSYFLLSPPPVVPKLEQNTEGNGIIITLYILYIYMYLFIYD